MTWRPGDPVSVGAELDWHLHGCCRSLRPTRNTSSLPQLAHVGWLAPQAPARVVQDDYGFVWFTLITPDGVIRVVRGGTAEARRP